MNMGMNSFPFAFLVIALIMPVNANLTPFGYTAYARFSFNTTRSQVVGISGKATVETTRVVRAQDYSYGGVGFVSLDANGNITSFMDTGYIVFPAKYGNSSPRFFVRYGNRAPNGKITGCFNVDCPGFVKTENQGILGTVLNQNSGFLNSNRLIHLSIIQHKTTKRWEVTFEGTKVGYWPDSLFTGARKTGFKADAGGTLFDSTGDRSPASQIGSGLPGILRNQVLVAYVTDVQLTEASGRKITLNGQRNGSSVIIIGERDYGTVNYTTQSYDIF